MDDVGAVEVQNRFHGLVHKVLDVLIRERLFRVDYLVEVGFHQRSDDVDVLEAGRLLWQLDLYDPAQIFVLEEFLKVTSRKIGPTQKFYLPENSLGIDQVHERVGDLFNRDLFACFSVVCGNDNSVRAPSDELDEFVFFVYHKVDRQSWEHRVDFPSHDNQLLSLGNTWNFA